MIAAATARAVVAFTQAVCWLHELLLSALSFFIILTQIKAINFLLLKSLDL